MLLISCQWESFHPILTIPLTLFMHQEHPGGPQAILKYAGKDATEPFDTFHSPDALVNLPVDKHLGLILAHHTQEAKSKTKDQTRVEEAHKSKLPLYRILNLAEMEVSGCSFSMMRPPA
jgi:hypothetical protein